MTYDYVLYTALTGKSISWVAVMMITASKTEPISRVLWWTSAVLAFWNAIEALIVRFS